MKTIIIKRRLLFIWGMALFSILSCQTNTDQEQKQVSEVQYRPIQKETDGNWSLVDTEGNYLIEDEFVNMPTCVIDSMFYMRQANGDIGLYKITDLRNPIRTDVEVYCLYSEGLGFATLKNNNHISCLDQNGNVVFELPSEVQIVRSFSNGLAMVQIIDQSERLRIGYVDKNGKIAISAKYYEGTPFYNNTAIVCDGKEAWYIDKEDKKIQRFADNKSILKYICTDVFDRLFYLPVRIEDVNKDWMPVFENGVCGVKTAEGKVVIPAGKYQYISCLEYGYALFYKKGSKISGILDKEGNEYIVNKGAYDIIGENKFACRNSNGDEFVCDKEGNIIKYDKSDEYFGPYSGYETCYRDTCGGGGIIETGKIFFGAMNPNYY